MGQKSSQFTDDELLDYQVISNYISKYRHVLRVEYYSGDIIIILL